MTIYTHQFDMHGTDTCDEFLWIDSETTAAKADEYMEIRFNSFFYDARQRLQAARHAERRRRLRVERLSQLVLPPFRRSTPALGGYVEHINTSGNRLGINENGNYGHCDFDRDGLADEFLATGQTWWFRSAPAARHWVT